MSMLHSVEGLQGFSIAATDGELGHVKDVYFDDRELTIRYVVVDTGGWLTGRRVLISPASVTGKDRANRTLSVNLTKQQVQNSPSIDIAKPVSRQHENEFYNYYGYPRYWSGPYLWGYTVFPTIFEDKPFEDPERQAIREEMEGGGRQDSHLRSADEVIGYDIQARDEAVGHIDDLMFDDENWKIELMVIDTRNWWPGKHVMVSPSRITRVNWESKTVDVDITREQIESSPEFDPDQPLMREKGEDLFRFFGR